MDARLLALLRDAAAGASPRDTFLRGAVALGDLRARLLDCVGCFASGCFATWSWIRRRRLRLGTRSRERSRLLVIGLFTAPGMAPTFRLLGSYGAVLIVYYTKGRENRLKDIQLASHRLGGGQTTLQWRSVHMSVHR